MHCIYKIFGPEDHAYRNTGKKATNQWWQQQQQKQQQQQQKHYETKHKNI